MARPADSTGCPWCHTHWTFQDVNWKPRWLLRQLRRATPAPGLSGNSGPEAAARLVGKARGAAASCCAVSPPPPPEPVPLGLGRPF